MSSQRCLSTYQRRPHLSGVRTFSHPDLTVPRFARAPEARVEPAPADGVLSEQIFSTTNLWRAHYNVVTVLANTNTRYVGAGARDIPGIFLRR